VVADWQHQEEVPAIKARFDGEAFFAALDAQRIGQGLTWRQVAKQCGVSASTLTRMSQGKLPDAQGLASLAAWAGLDTAKFLCGEDFSQPSQPEPLAMISTYLRSDPNLSPEGAVALDELIKATYERLRKQ
jgi:transcriptional regulator with XRE-family HTH domain